MRTRRHDRSTTLRRYRAGVSGRIASAGGMRTARRTADCAPSAATARLTITDSDGDADRQMKVEGREPEELVVEANHARAEPGAGRDAGQRARSGDHERPLDVVPGQLPIRVSERLERGDLRALQRQRARQRDVQDEGRDAEEDGGRDEAEGLELSTARCRASRRRSGRDRGIAPKPP